MKFAHLLVLCFGTIIIPRESFGLKVRFFGGEQNELFQSESMVQCTNLPHWMTGKVHYVKTEGCAMIFVGTDCKSFSTKVEATAEEFRNIYDLLGNNTPSSFHPCNETEGGDQVNVDFYGEVFPDEKYPPETSMTAQLHDLCSCTKLAGNISSLNNHGNCIELFDDDKCTEPGVQIPAGRTAKSDNLISHGSENKKSVRFCEEPPHCLRLSATVVKFEIQDSQDKHLQSLSRTLDVQMAIKGTFINNGNATVTQEYVAKKMVQETTYIKRVQSLSTMNSVNVSGSVQYDNKFSLPFIDQSQLSVNFAAGYNFTRKSTEEAGEGHSVVESKEFQATQKIEIPPCTSYEISSYVKFAEKYPLQYAIHVNISGFMGSERLEAEEIAKRLTDLQWVSNLDRYTVYAKGKSTASVDFGMESFVNGNSILTNCSTKAE